MNFPKQPKMREASREGKQQHLCSALNSYLLEPEGEPAIVPEREYKKGEEMRVYLCCCLKTRLFLIHLTQVAERSPQNEGGFPACSNLLILPKSVAACSSYMYAWSTSAHRNTFFLQILLVLIYLYSGWHS